MRYVKLNNALEILKAANDIPANKQKEYDAAIESFYEQVGKAVPFFEKAYSINPSDSYVIQCLKECYYRLKNVKPEYTEKCNDIEAKINAAEKK